MAINYAKLAATALRLIKANGHQITVNALGTTPADNTKPWRGQVDDHSPLADSRVLWAIDAGLASSDVGTVTANKDLPKDTLGFYLVAPELDTPILDDYDEVVDGGVTLKIIKIVKVKPANTVLLYELQVQK